MMNDVRGRRERWSLIGLPDLLLLLSLGVELAADVIPRGTGKRHQSHVSHPSPDHSGLTPPPSILKLTEGCPLSNSARRPSDRRQVGRSHTVTDRKLKKTLWKGKC